MIMETHTYTMSLSPKQKVYFCYYCNHCHKKITDNILFVKEFKQYRNHGYFVKTWYCSNSCLVSDKL